METFVDAYIECAIWSSIGDDGEPLDRNYSADDLSAEALAEMTADCDAFVEANQSDLDAVDRDYAHCGHDFWLTRNGHGTGFWDRYYGKNEELRAAYMRLSDEAKAYGTCDIYVGDDGKLHI